MKVEKRRVEELLTDPSNVRRHSDRNVEAIQSSLRRFGLQKPIVIDAKGVVVAGNGTLLAAKLEGIEEVFCVVTDLDSYDARAFAIADNRTTDLSSFDSELLAQHLEALRSQDEELAFAAGFSEEELQRLLDGGPGDEGFPSVGGGDENEFKTKCPKCGFEFDPSP